MNPAVGPRLDIDIPIPRLDLGVALQRVRVGGVIRQHALGQARSLHPFEVFELVVDLCKNNKAVSQLSQSPTCSWYSPIGACTPPSLTRDRLA